MSEAAVSDRGGVSADALGELERHVEAHRLQVLAWLADRKLRSVRLSVDFALAARASGCRCNALGGLEALVTEEMLDLVERDSLLDQP